MKGESENLHWSSANLRVFGAGLTGQASIASLRNQNRGPKPTRVGCTLSSKAGEGTIMCKTSNDISEGRVSENRPASFVAVKIGHRVDDSEGLSFKQNIKPIFPTRLVLQHCNLLEDKQYTQGYLGAAGSSYCYRGC